MVRELIAKKQKEVRGKKKGYEQSTIKNILAPLRAIYNHAIDEDDAFMNPAARVGKFNKKSSAGKDVNPLTGEEVPIVLGKALETIPIYYPLLLCAVRTGMREGELVAAKGIDVDLRNRLLHVQRSLSRGKIKLPKNGKARKVDMSQQLTNVLSELLSKRRSDALRKEMQQPAELRRDAAAVINEVMESWLFTTPAGTQIDPSNLRKLFNKLLTDAKLGRRVRFHDLRHTFASLHIQNGESLAYVRDQLGHSSIKVTVDIYGHLVPGGNRKAADRLDDNPINGQENVAG